MLERGDIPSPYASFSLIVLSACLAIISGGDLGFFCPCKEIERMDPRGVPPSMHSGAAVPLKLEVLKTNEDFSLFSFSCRIRRFSDREAKSDDHWQMTGP